MQLVKRIYPFCVGTGFPKREAGRSWWTVYGTEKLSTIDERGAHWATRLTDPSRQTPDVKSVS